MRIRSMLLALTVFCLSLAQIQARLETNLNPARIHEIAGMLPDKPKGFGPSIIDRAAWDRIAKEKSSQGIVAHAATLAEEPVPATTDDGFLDYSRTGNRDRYQHILFARSDRLAALVLAECLENKGRFINALTNTIDSFCQERTWVYPAHDSKLNNFYGRTLEMDLRATAVGWDLATVYYLLGDKLPPVTRDLIRNNVKRRVLQPFANMVQGRRDPINWLHATHNWNAVCISGVAGAALALADSKEERALYVAAAEHYIRYFLSGFTPDGYCSEGMGYWNYGFGHFLMLGEAVRQATGGKIDLLADPAAHAPAFFCMRDEIINGIYPTISDCSPGVRPSQVFVDFIKARFGLSDGFQDRTLSEGDLVGSMLFGFVNQPLPVIANSAYESVSPMRTWFTNGGVLICRASEKQFAAVLKGGNNSEHHNHNDVGSFSVVIGHTMIVCDPGGEVYTSRTFGAHRYESKVLNSFGHAVPVVAGELQRTGADARADAVKTSFTDEEDVLGMDIRSAYAVPALTKLQRTFRFQRANAKLIVEDEVEFTNAKPFETALITWSEWKQTSPHEIVLADGNGSARVEIDTGNAPFSIKAETINEDVHTPKKPVHIGIVLNEPVQHARVRMTIIPKR